MLDYSAQAAPKRLIGDALNGYLMLRGPSTRAPGQVLGIVDSGRHFLHTRDVTASTGSMSASTLRRRPTVPRDLDGLAGPDDILPTGPDRAVEVPRLPRLVPAAQENEVEVVATPVVDDASAEHIVRALRREAALAVGELDAPRVAEAFGHGIVGSGQPLPGVQLHDSRRPGFLHTQDRPRVRAAGGRLGDPEVTTRLIRAVLQRSRAVSVLFAGSIEGHPRTTMLIAQHTHMQAIEELRRALNALRDAGVIEHAGRGSWEAPDPLLRRYLCARRIR